MARTLAMRKEARKEDRKSDGIVLYWDRNSLGNDGV